MTQLLDFVKWSFSAKLQIWPELMPHDGLAHQLVGSKAFSTINQSKIIFNNNSIVTGTRNATSVFHISKYKMNKTSLLTIIALLNCFAFASS